MMNPTEGAPPGRWRAQADSTAVMALIALAVSAWVALDDQVHPNIPVTAPKTPMIVKAGGVEVVTLLTMLSAAEAERSSLASQGAAFLGIRVTPFVWADQHF